jgi:hypothetical protein
VTADPVYVWRCTDGHETAHSDIEIRSLTVTPRCTLLLADGSRCRKALLKRVRQMVPEAEDRWWPK